jgi:hypothetical protein
MRTFGIISEGPSDQIIIENILVGYFNDLDLPEKIRFLQPMHDATDDRKHGGWLNVFEYCKSQYFIEALEQNDYLIIQIDTDSCEEVNFDVSRRNAHGEVRTPKEMISKVVEKFEELFSANHAEKFYLFKERILFAICVEEIECWLLPLYHTDKNRSRTYGCIQKLNPRIEAKFGVFIDKGNKSVALPHYDKFSRAFIKRKTIDSVYDDNISLKVFLDSLAKVDLNYFPTELIATFAVYFLQIKQQLYEKINARCFDVCSHPFICT